MMRLPTLELRIALRYLAARNENGFVGFITVVGALSVAIGVAVLLVVLGVMNGFERELQTRLLSMTAHATLSSVDGPLGDWRPLVARVRGEAHVVAVAPYIEERGLLAHGAEVSGVLLRGIDPAAERAVSGIAEHVPASTLERLTAGDFRIVLGKQLAAELHAAVGDTVVLAVPQGTVTPAGVVPRVRRFTVIGLLDSGLYELDRSVALVSLGDAARVFRLGDAVSGLRLKVDDPFAAGRVVRSVAVDLGGGFYISDWTREHANFFRSIATTKSIMFVLLLLVIGVAAFNIVATLVMLVREKRADIAILRTLGLTPAALLRVFVLQGSAIAVLGTGLGLGLGLLVAARLSTGVRLLESLLGTTLIDARVYYIDELPALITVTDAVTVCGTAIAVGCLATLYPAFKAARTQPAEALRHD